MTFTWAAGVTDGNTTKFTGTGDVGTADEGYTVLKYAYRTGDGATTWTVPSGLSEVEYLVVAGGGGGGAGASNAAGSGGGGAGGLVTGLYYPSGTQSITVGVGGTGGGQSADGQNGGNSTFGSIIALGGGGGGGTVAHTGKAGGSSGGGAYPYGSGTAALQPTSESGGYGNAGSNGAAPGDYSGGHGGGAGAAGGPVGYTGKGGAGINSSITGIAVIYAGGGTGGIWWEKPTHPGKADGGLAPGINGVANLGGGGAGVYSAYPGGNGGSGVVIIKYYLQIPVGNCLGKTSQATATITSYQLTGGAWDGTGTGYYVLTDVVGTFQDGEKLITHPYIESATIDGTIIPADSSTTVVTPEESHTVTWVVDVGDTITVTPEASLQWILAPPSANVGVTATATVVVNWVVNVNGTVYGVGITPSGDVGFLIIVPGMS